MTALLRPTLRSLAPSSSGPAQGKEIVTRVENLREWIRGHKDLPLGLDKWDPKTGHGLPSVAEGASQLRKPANGPKRAKGPSDGAPIDRLHQYESQCAPAHHTHTEPTATILSPECVGPSQRIPYRCTMWPQVH